MLIDVDDFMWRRRVTRSRRNASEVSENWGPPEGDFRGRSALPSTAWRRWKPVEQSVFCSISPGSLRFRHSLAADNPVLVSKIRRNPVSPSVSPIGSKKWS